MNIKGAMTHVTVSGGFWGILGDDGKRYRPVQPLAPEFMVEGLRVAVLANPWQGMSIYMWGIDIEITSIKVIS